LDLTIAIPTYNRSSYLARLLGLLTATNLNNIKILIVDNCSTDDTEQVTKSYCDKAPKQAINYYRNPANIGADANILRCFELADTEWLWIVGDDDLPVPNCIDIVQATISAHQDCQYLNFASTILALRVSRRSGFTTSGIDELVASIDCYSNLLFVSSGVYKRTAFLKHLPKAYRFIYAYSTQLALVFSVMAEDSNKKCYFSPELLIEWEPPPKAITWSQDLFTLGAPFVSEALSSIKLRDEFIIKVREIQEIAPSLTLRKLLALSLHEGPKLALIQKQYNILATLTPSYAIQASIAHLLVLCTKRRALMKLIRILERVSKSKFRFAAKPASSLLDFDLLCKDIRIPLLSFHDAKIVTSEIRKSLN